MFMLYVTLDRLQVDIHNGSHLKPTTKTTFAFMKGPLNNFSDTQDFFIFFFNPTNLFYMC